MSLRIKKVPLAVKQASSMADKKAAMQRFVDQSLEGMGHQLTVPSGRIEGQEHRRFTAQYHSAHRIWQLQVENPAQDMEIAHQLLKRISQQVTAQTQDQGSQSPATTPDKPTAHPDGLGSAPAPGGRPGSDTLKKPGGPPDDAKGDGPKGTVTGSG